jgi:C1A family cysteine protease
MKKAIAMLVVILICMGGVYAYSNQKQGKIIKSEQFQDCVAQFQNNTVQVTQGQTLDLRLEGVSLANFSYGVCLGQNMEIMVSMDFMQDVMGCSVVQYPDGDLMVERGENTILLAADSEAATVNQTRVSLANGYFTDDNGTLYLPVSEYIDKLGYQADYDFADRAVNFTKVSDESVLPARYDMREKGRVTAVRDQGKYGTCWAFASLGALETTLMPMEEAVYSTDHMTLNNSYNLDLSLGGEHTMSIAYLAAWQGPVYEADDPYGDGKTDSNLSAVKHLQEAIVINERNDDTIKGAIFRYGGVETSLYLQMTYVGDYSKYYNSDTAAYYYNGTQKPNHDVVIVGWDDNYSKENFAVQPEQDGAYICKNSWGTEFGEDGYFYVSYEDVNICNQSIIYSRLEEPDNYDKIYQSDLLGWVGQMGFGGESAYFANVYKTDKNEELAAVSFYATGENTKFSVYLVQEFTDSDSLTNRQLLMTGETRYAGYYTAELTTPVPLLDDTEFAVVVYITTPGSERPIAIEYNTDVRTAQADLSDGKGYISLYGEAWHSAEETQDCNICLKAFTNVREE